MEANQPRDAATAPATPVSWLLVEQGWAVVSPTGEQLGTVHRVVADRQKDIFSGLAVSPGLLSGNRLLPAESVLEIVEGAVVVALERSELAALPGWQDGAARG